MQPTWTVLAVAFLGVAGTLGAAVFTQIWGARREDRRWHQEQLADSQRWERQRQERREQWQREDQLRAAQHQQEAYTQFLLAMAKWATAAYSAIVQRADGAGTPTTEELSRLGTLAELAEAACVPVRLHGSEEVSVASDEVCRVMLSTVRAYADGSMDTEQVDQALTDFRLASELVLDRVRADLKMS